MDWLTEANGDIDFSLIAAVEAGGGYDGIKSTGRRKSPTRVVQSEDRHLRNNDRRVLISTTRDMRRNFVMPRWAIHKHIDFVVDHSFQPRSGNEAFDTVLSEFFKMASKRENFDISGRHNLRRFMRLAEASRIIDGDFFAVRKRGGFLQAIEADRVKNPTILQGDVIPQEEKGWINGVRINSVGKHMQYSIHRRFHSNFIHERDLSARKVIAHGFYDRFDQTRGVSPLAATINTIKDLSESYDYALAKGKVAQLFALAITRDADWGLGEDENDGNTDPNREVSFTKGPQILDLETGEDAKFLSTNVPGEETAAFWQEQTALVLKALNIPYSFWEEAHTNFNGSRTALILYLRSVEQWREDVVAFMNDWFCWRLKVGQLRGEIQMPADFECDPKNWMWIPTGIEYWDPMKEISADKIAIAEGLDTRTRITLERKGVDWETVILPELIKEKKLMEAGGVFIDPNPEPPETDEPKKPAKKD